MKQELIITFDGSHTLFVPEMEEHYHSINGAVQESRHVFLKAGLNQLNKKQIRILEIGFGTGLNAFLTLLEGEKKDGLHIEYYSVEKYPIAKELVEKLNYGNHISPEKENLFHILHASPWEQETIITPTFSLYKIEGDANTCHLPEKIDLIYFDAFAPDKQADLWNEELFTRLFNCMNKGGVFTTYCAKGIVRRSLQQVGFVVERIPGPPGKREMLRGRKE